MQTGSKLYLSWWDFCGYLSDFEDFVYDGVFHKMDYRMYVTAASTTSKEL